MGDMFHWAQKIGGKRGTSSYAGCWTYCNTSTVRYSIYEKKQSKSGLTIRLPMKTSSCWSLSRVILGTSAVASVLTYPRWSVWIDSQYRLSRDAGEDI